jgi:hypothetical protein
MTTPYIDNIGIIATDLDQALEKMRGLFGDPIWIKNGWSVRSTLNSRPS